MIQPSRGLKFHIFMKIRFSIRQFLSKAEAKLSVFMHEKIKTIFKVFLFPKNLPAWKMQSFWD